jgi:CHAD domain-containing protein
VPPRRDRTAAELVRGALADHVELLDTHGALLRTESDPEHVHQARVATRRLRSDLRSFEEVFDPNWVIVVRDELRWIADVLGSVRDADVLRARLAGAAGTLPPDDARAANVLLRRLSRTRTAARARLVRALDSRRFAGMRAALEPGAVERSLAPAAALPAGEVLPPQVERRWRQLARAIEEMGEDPSDEELHDVRIRAKRARYAAEAAVPVMGKPARRAARMAAELQGVLGDLHDAVVSAAWLRGVAPGLDPGQALVAGQLLARELQAADRVRASWAESWERAAAGVPA